MNEIIKRMMRGVILVGSAFCLGKIVNKTNEAQRRKKSMDYTLNRAKKIFKEGINDKEDM